MNENKKISLITKTITPEQEKMVDKFLDKQKEIAENYNFSKQLLGGLTASND